MGKLALAFALVLVSFGSAAAQDLPAVTAHLECLTGTKALKNGKKAVLAGDVTCAIIIDGGAVPDVSTSAMLTLTQPNRWTEPRWGTLTVEEGVAFVAFPSAFVRKTDFLPCQDFKVEGALGMYGSDVSQSLWHGSFTVKAKCSKPKKLKAKFACVATADDGTRFKYPGNGAKEKPRLEVALTCTVTGKKKLKGDPGSFGFFVAAPLNTLLVPLATLANGKPHGELQVIPDREFDTCVSFTLKASIQNDVGQVVWSGKQKIAQSCPD